MRVYFSHVMTKATEVDRLFQDSVRDWAEEVGMKIWDPKEHEAGLKTMYEFQEKDWAGVRDSSLHLVAWSIHAPESRGLNAELEWAARHFHIPILVVRAPDALIERRSRPRTRP